MEESGSEGLHDLIVSEKDKFFKVSILCWFVVSFNQIKYLKFFRVCAYDKIINETNNKYKRKTCTQN